VRFGSLRSRLLVGAGLWTIGLLAIGVLVTGAILSSDPHYPRAFHVSAEAHAGVLIVFAVACMIMGLWQVKRGLAPIEQLRQRLSDVREGRSGRLDGAYPSEVQPLVDDLNLLLEHRETAVARALAKAGDLAHGLKTPLAVLTHEAGRVSAAGHPDLAAAIEQQIDRMGRQAEYHLAQARAAASGSLPGARCDLHDAASGLIRTLLHLHAERGLTIENEVEAAHQVRCQREDVDEMLGNLLDNACKWARSGVRVRSARADGVVTVSVDDDGPGLAPELRTEVLRRGVRADEQSPGSGLGLAIVRDLAGLYGGAIGLEQSPHGGVRAVLRLPAYTNPGSHA
jgi:signal transduction histidine kinase